MADHYSDIPELSAEAQGLARRRKIAEAMMAQSMQPIESAGIVGGIPARNSWLQGVAKVVQAYMANKQANELTSAEKELAGKYSGMESETQQAVRDAMLGTPEQVKYLPQDQAGPPQTIPAKPGSIDNVIAAMLASRLPQYQQQGQALQLQQLQQRQADENFQKVLSSYQQPTPGWQVLTGEIPGSAPMPGMPDPNRPGFVGSPADAMALINRLPPGPDKDAATAQLQAQAGAAPQSQGINPLLLSRDPRAKMLLEQQFRDQQARIAAEERSAARAESDQRSADLRRELQANALAVTAPDAKVKAKLMASLPQARLRTETMVQSIDRLDSALDDLAKDPGLSNITGTLYGRTPNVTNAATGAQAKLDSIKSQIFQSSLQSMREASKTGGAVGNVSDREGDKLERTLGALDQAQRTEDFLKQIGKIREQIRQSRALIKAAFDEQYGEVDAVPAAPSDNAEPTSPRVVDW